MPASSSPSSRNVGGPIALAILLALGAYGVNSHRPPEPLPADAPAVLFSAARAHEHVAAACREPHPAGTAANDKVLDYIAEAVRDLGPAPEIHRLTSVRHLGKGPLRPGTNVGNLKNLVVRLRGTEPTKAILLMAHYDSVAWGPGAADDCSGCATLLETMRALRVSRPLKNDVIFLFTDAEEGGLLGAHAFVREHPYFKDVGLVINFDTRGTNGPSYMFETGANNGTLIRHFIRAASRPMSNSFMVGIYRRMGVNSDYSPFRDSGVQGLNHAFIGNIAYYHTANDSPENLDLGSLQHHGHHALELTRYFGNLDLPLAVEPARDAVYFNLTPSIMAHYSSRWVMPLFLLTVIAFIAVCRLGKARGLVSISGLIKGAAASLAALLAAAAVAGAVMFIAWKRHSYYFVYDNALYYWGGALVGLAAALAAGWFVRRRARPEESALGALVWWLVLLGVAAFFMPGASFVFQWPLAFALAGISGWLLMGGASTETLGVQLNLCGFLAPGVLLFSPLIPGLGESLTGIFAPALAAVTALLGALLWPVWISGKWPGRRVLFAALFLTTGVLFGVALAGKDFSPERPQLTSVSYGLNLDTGVASWLSRTGAEDEWASQFFNQGRQTAHAQEFLPRDKGQYLRAAAPVAPLEPLQVEVLTDESANGVRKLRLRLVSPRRAPRAEFVLGGDVEVLRAAVNGAPYASGKPWMMQYRPFGAEPAELELELREPAGPVRLTVIETSYGLPETPGFKPRPMPDHVILEPNTTGWGKGLRSNWTMVRKTHVLGAGKPAQSLPAPK